MHSFGENLKKYRVSLGLSQRELGERIGLNQTTIANYENNVRFPKSDNLKKIALLLNISIDGLFLQQQSPSYNDFDEQLYDASQRKFLEALFNWDEFSALEIIKNLGKSTTNILYIYEKIIKKSLYDVGELWSLGRINVLEEHFIAQVCQKSIALISHEVSIKSQLNETALCMTINPEEHTIGLLIICNTLKTLGIKAYYIGSKIPTNSLIDVLIRHNITYLVMSISMKEHFDGLINLIAILRQEKALKTLKIIVGGRAFDNDFSLFMSSGADIYAKDSFDLIEKLSH